ncbi:ModD protein [Chlorobaculum sp. 24CR]|uniref:ModD protein n=1 Tax=Chlorobaculum sp. 24CR TaxID=2508878 RepID=UPI00100AF56F|nr:ModD protein [Chlorobaculum sp. 24CR]RXK84719.1 ModD protein [Chlorobaculum sp. 24CR]
MYSLTPDSEIERYIEEDAPYGDLTTTLLGIGAAAGEIAFTTRERTTVCCTEEAGRVLARCGAEVLSALPSGTVAAPGTEILRAAGPAAALHAGWKVAMNLLEYASGISTRTATIVERARAANPAVSVVTTRKSFPGTKKIAIKAIMAGGAFPHRLGLSESILVFSQHTAFLGGLDPFLEKLPDLKKLAPEQKILVEADSAEEALRIAAAGADVVQVDKMPVAELAALCSELRSRFPGVAVSAAGGINGENAASYAATGIDIIVLSSVYFGKPADIATSITHTPKS